MVAFLLLLASEKSWLVTTKKILNLMIKRTIITSDAILITWIQFIIIIFDAILITWITSDAILTQRQSLASQTLSRTRQKSALEKAKRKNLSKPRVSKNSAKSKFRSATYCNEAILNLTH